MWLGVKVISIVARYMYSNLLNLILRLKWYTNNKMEWYIPKALYHTYPKLDGGWCGDCGCGFGVIIAEISKNVLLTSQDRIISGYWLTSQNCVILLSGECDEKAVFVTMLYKETKINCLIGHLIWNNLFGSHCWYLS